MRWPCSGVPPCGCGAECSHVNVVVVEWQALDASNLAVGVVCIGSFVIVGQQALGTGHKQLWGSMYWRQP